MSDDADNAAEIIEQTLAQALAKKKPGLARTGKCHYCDEALDNPDGVFCNKECSDDYEKEKRLKGGPVNTSSPATGPEPEWG